MLRSIAGQFQFYFLICFLFRRDAKFVVKKTNAKNIKEICCFTFKSRVVQNNESIEKMLKI